MRKCAKCRESMLKAVKVWTKWTTIKQQTQPIQNISKINIFSYLFIQLLIFLSQHIFYDDS